MPARAHRDEIGPRRPERPSRPLRRSLRAPFGLRMRPDETPEMKQTSRDVEHEIETRGRWGGASQTHQQLFTENRVAVVAGFVWEIELRGQDRPVRSLYFHMVMPRPARIARGLNRRELITPFAVAENVPAPPKSLVVVFAGCIRVPQINECIGERSATARQHKSGDHDRRAV